MKKLQKSQLLLQGSYSKSSIGRELEEIDNLLESLPDWVAFLTTVQEDLPKGKQLVGGMTIEQIVKAGLVKSLENCSYRKLSDLTADSQSVSRFLGLGFNQTISSSALQANISLLQESHWELLNHMLLQKGLELGIETGDVLRSDTTVTETNIHHPTDSSLLVDGIRILTRLLTELEQYDEIAFSNHNRRAKSRLYDINNAKSAEARLPLYKNLMEVAGKTLGYVKDYLKQSEGSVEENSHEHLCYLRDQLECNQTLMGSVIQQAFRRVIKGETVPAEDKVVSFVEPHTDIIKKGGRETLFGHKVSLSAGFYLVTDVEVLDGNPADSTLVEGILKSHLDVYGRAPEELALDGCYASLENRDLLKGAGVRELTFCKNGAIPEESLVSSKGMGKELRNFRAGIEGIISSLKRDYGLGRILEKGRERFDSVVRRAVAAFNLRTMVRLL